MSATRKSIKDMADRLISTLSSTMPNEQADAIVRDVAEELYRSVLGVQGNVVPATRGIVHGSFGAMTVSDYKFEPIAASAVAKAVAAGKPTCPNGHILADNTRCLDKKCPHRTGVKL